MIIRDKSFWSLRPNTQDEFIVNEVYYGNCYRLPEDMTGITVIDVGANVGAFTVACLDRGAKVIAYEPDRECFDLLYEHTFRYNPDQYSIYKSAVVGNNRSECKLDLFYPSSGDVDLTGGKSIYRYSEVCATTVDCVDIGSVVLFENNLWLKLDCEGAEYEILLSSLPWDRIDRVFGECHDLIDGRLSKDTGEVSIDLGEGVSINRNTIVSCLEQVGYRVELTPNPDDIHLSLFWAERVSSYKQVAILTPFRNARGNLPLYFNQVSSLRDSLLLKGYTLRLVAAEGDSLDGTRERIEALSASHGIPLVIADTTHGGMRWGSVEDPVRMKVMSDVMNKALSEVVESDDIVVWIMSDLKWDVEDIEWLIKDLEESDRFQVLAPLVFIGGAEDKLFYDTWAYRRGGERFYNKFPFHDDFYKLIHDDDNPNPPAEIEIDSAGTCLVMQGKVACNCRASNLEAVSFCENARGKGYRIGLSTSWQVYHYPPKSKRLLFIGDALCNTGFSRVTHALLPSLAEAGYELDIIAINYDGIPHNHPYRFWPAAVRGQAGALGEYRIQQLVMAFNFDVIVLLNDVWNVAPLMEVLDQCKKHGALIPPVIAYLTVDSVNQKGKELNVLAKVVCCTEFGRDELVRTGCTTPISVVPFGVDTSKFRPMDRSESRKWASDGQIGDEVFVVGYVGTAQYRKRLDLLIKAFAVWLGRYPERDSYLYLCISNMNHNSVDIDSLVEYYGLKGRVLSPDGGGRLDDESLAKIYSSFDVLVSCALGEGFGLTILESMACGVPSLFANNSGPGSWIDKDCPGRIECSSTALLGPMNSNPYTIGSVIDVDDLLDVLDYYWCNGNRSTIREVGLSIAESLPWSLTASRFVEVVEGVVVESREKEELKSNALSEIEIYRP